MYDKNIKVVSSGEFGEDLVKEYDAFSKEMFLDKHTVSPCDEVIVRAIPKGYTTDMQFLIVESVQNFVDIKMDSQEFDSVKIEELETDRKDFRFFKAEFLEDGFEDDPTRAYLATFK